MEQTPLHQQASPVLNYAPKSPERRATRWLRAIVLAPICAVLVGFAGQMIRPVSYTSVGFLQVTAPSPIDGSHTLTQSQQRAAVTDLTSPASLAAGVAAAKANGVTLTPAQIQRNLNVVAVPQSKLVEVAYSSPNTALAVTIVNGIMTNATATSPIVIIATPAPAAIAVHATPLFTMSFALLGAIAGFSAGWFWRRR